MKIRATDADKSLWKINVSSETRTSGVCKKSSYPESSVNSSKSSAVQRISSNLVQSHPIVRNASLSSREVIRDKESSGNRQGVIASQKNLIVIVSGASGKLRAINLQVSSSVRQKLAQPATVAGTPSLSRTVWQSGDSEEARRENLKEEKSLRRDPTRTLITDGCL